MGNHQLTNPNVVSFPAGINSGVLAVGATDDHDNIANFSAQGPHIDVSAPGVGIVSTNFNNGYIDLSGTSMATPHVAGLASLLKGFNTNLANDDIEQIIRLTADDRLPVGFDNAFGTGRINAERALQSLQAPNTLQQLSTTSGTIFSTSASMTRVFLGFPGLPDAAYVVKRSEVRKAITLPVMCSTIGVWGRGVGTTGYREENGRCFGEGICEVVPGTLTAAGCTLRTWIYEVWSASGQYLGFYPRSANNVVFQYTILGVPAPTGIIGDNAICTTSSTYAVNNLQAGASVNWQVTPATGIVNTSTPAPNQITLTKVTNGTVTLTATVSGSCLPPPVTFTKTIPVGSSISGYYTTSLDPTQIAFSGDGSKYVTAQRNQYVTFNFNITNTVNVSNIAWSSDNVSATGNTFSMGWYASPYGYGQVIKYVYIDVTSPCGITRYVFTVTIQSIGGFGIVAVSPNPATESINLTFTEQSTSKILEQNLTPLRSLKSKGKTIISLFEFNTNMLVRQWTRNEISNKNYNFNIAGLRKGLYILQVDRDNEAAVIKIIVE